MDPLNDNVSGRVLRMLWGKDFSGDLTMVVSQGTRLCCVEYLKGVVVRLPPPPSVPGDYHHPSLPRGLRTSTSDCTTPQTEPFLPLQLHPGPSVPGT